MPCSYLLVSHGSRDPRPEIAMQELAKLLIQRLPKGENLVGTAALEVQSQPLHQQIQQFANDALAVGCNSLKIVPLFLLPGVHLMTDIPAEVALAKMAFNGNITINLQPHVGSHPGLGKLLTQSMANIESEALILLAHGSRRPLSLQPVEAIAASLRGITAYWSVPPSLDSRVQQLVADGKREIAILPYFLFSGGITDAIALAVETLKLQFPSVNFQLAPPLGPSAELADLIWDLTKEGEKVVG
ncbi:sirohydrochlorin chelatase [Cronbergia sp. UHCC 0137]|uniref:sirohydrochlorin chelatase n=1 Tax=Cronbergia sp. UHCC 0137 TaxID=3110239 RepID=UPI002B1F3A3D|nr:sirohydrochlorin chelatase [Cronbergia sp. UHCC 0137]MEA5619735.1 sirohydrochlorin chelatase [Cronbergia sp. UHCC 0137]